MNIRPVARRLAIAIALCSGGSAAAEPATGPVVLVLPFENASGDARLAWLREGMALHLTDALAGDAVTAVGREDRLQAYERLTLSRQAALSRASQLKLGQLAAATGVVVGRFTLANDELTVSARIIRVDEGALRPEVTARGGLASLFATLDALAGALGAELGPTQGRWPPSVAAFEQYVRGLTDDTPARGVRTLEQALTSAPQYDRARLALWRALTDTDAHQRAHDVAARMRADSPFADEARFLAALSLVHLKHYDESLRALQALSGSSTAAVVANAMGVVELRRSPVPQPGRATYYFSQAKDADPEDGDLFFNLGYAYYLERDMHAALYWLREAVRRNPGDGQAHGVLGASLGQLGAAAEAARERELASRLMPSYAEWDKRASAGGDPVPRGLERLHDQFHRPPPAADARVTGSEQRDQASLAAFHLDAGRRAFERQADREALQSLRRALFLSPYLAEAHVLLGRVYLRGGRTENAIAAFKIAVWSDDTVEAHVALAEAYVQAKDDDAAREEVARALALDPASPSALSLKSQLAKTPW